AVADSGPEGWSAQMDSQGQYWLVSELSEALHIDETNPMLELGVKRLSAPHGRSSHRTSPRRSGAPAGFLEKIPTLGTFRSLPTDSLICRVGRSEQAI
ncbi:MAG: hypothetical protein SGPRY_006875, partial [Prymnesium sp.]